MATNFIPVGAEVQVNLAPNQNFDQGAGDTAALTDGRFFVAFEDADPGRNIIGQFVNPDGTLAGGNINIDTGPGVRFDPAVAQRAGGAAVVVWRDFTAGDDIHYAIVSSTGVVGAELTILDGANGLGHADVATLADGRSLVVATQATANDDIVFRFIDAAGTPAASAQDFIDNGAGSQVDGAVAAFGNSALVVYRDDTTGSLDVQARFFDGTSFAAEVTVADELGDVLSLDVAALSDGRFVVVWEDDTTGDIHARFVSVAGAPLGNVFAITQGDGSDADARVAALPGGGFIVTWENEGASLGSEVDPENGAVFARRFDSNGDPAGDVFLVNTGDPNSHQDRPSLAVNANGQAFIVWEDSHNFFPEGDIEPEGVRGHAFLATTETVNGSDGDDSIKSYNLGEPINGLGGDDLINALGGADIVHGGTGFDHIKGGLGNDQLFGDGGDDLLKGEEGDDLLVGGLGRDTQLGGAGRDTFDFNAITESRIGANHDVIKQFKHSEHDRIDLQTIDAVTTAGGNQAFDFIGGAGFSGAAGELRLSGGLLLGDTNGNGIADFEIKVTGIGAGAASDFAL